MSEHTWRELERADMDAAAAHVFDMEYRAEQIASEARKRLERMEHIVNGLGEVNGEIVRCRDCKFLDPRDEECGGRNWCKRMSFEVTPDGFCAWGERNNALTAQNGVAGTAHGSNDGKAAS